MANDNLLAGIASGLQGAQGVLVPFFNAQVQDKLLRRRAAEDDQRAYQNKLALMPHELQSQIELERTRQDKPNTVITPTGELVGNYRGNVEIAPGEKRYGRKILKSKAIEILKSGGEIGAEDQVIDDMPNASQNKGEQSKINEAKTALAIINRLESDFMGAPSGLTAVGSRLSSFATGGALGSKKLRTYEDALNANATKFYRAYTGDTRLSDSDAKDRAYKLLPGGFINKTQGSSKFSDLKANVLLGVRPILEKAGIDENDFVEEAKNFKTPYDSPAKAAPTAQAAVGKSPKPGGVLQEDDKGNRAWVYQDGTFDEVK